MSKRICPYCYKAYLISDLNLYCKKCEKDFLINQLKWVDKASFKVGSLPKLDYCINCGKIKRSNILFKCSSCKQSLSRDIIELKNKVISIVGGRGSGKTIYISLLIDFIENNIKLGNDQTFTSIEGDKREDKDDLVAMIQDRIKQEKSVPDPTEPRELESDESTAGIPLIYFYTNKEETIL
jgi:ribosomal protein L32